ncbi:MAG TPA: histidinol-phosphate transaminase [Leucothrix mucor]|uniref:Histidinol-phosphate aminotransferase n=2 Tax=Leucothrix mucor TaxID=45248 RepID=A0A7V2SYE1_LEUMU|nr:histidinol-phosphate transaminase [Leucothrix mucor]
MKNTFLHLAVSGVQGLNPYQPGKPITELERELGISNILKLASNENPMGASKAVLEALKGDDLEVEVYPDGNGFMLKQAIAKKLALQQDQITLGNGSNDVLDIIARTFLCQGREAIFSQYAFAVYPIATQAVGATMKIAAALPVEHTTMPYGHDLDAMLLLISDKTRVIFIANPNNPTGTWLDASSLKTFIDQVPEDVIVVVDEAYFEYVNEVDYPDTLQWLDDYPNLIVTRTFSKIYGLASLRVGYAVCSAEIADLLNRVRQPFNVNSFALLAATTALENTAHIEKCAESNREGLRFWREACQQRQLAFIPTVGNFITVDMGQDAMPIYEALLREGVIVRPVANYGLPHHLRITIGTAEQNNRCLAALDKVL